MKLLMDKSPRIDTGVYIAPTARLYWDVRVGKDTSIWDFTVIRADHEPISIGEGCSIQEHTMIHVDEGFPVTIGNFVTVGHRAVIHGATIGNHCIIGIGAIVLNGARVGNHCIVAAGAVVKENQQIPDNSLVAGVPARVIKTLSPEQLERIRVNAEIYIHLKEEYLKRQESL